MQEVEFLTPTDTSITNTELYDGTSWTAGNVINTARNYGIAAGIQTAGLIAGGTPS
jgi:hypothetical protein